MEEFGFRNRSGYRLAASLAVPEAVSRPAVVVFMHTLGGHRGMPRDRAATDRLLQAGIAAFLLDFTGHGESEGAPAYLTGAQMEEDLVATVDLLSSLPEVDANRLGASACHYAGLPALRLACRDPRIRALVLQGVPAEAAECLAAASLTVPALVIATGGDAATVEEERHLARAFAGEHRFAAVPGADDLVAGPGQTELLSRLTADWFIRQLAPVRTAAAPATLPAAAH